MSSMFRKTLLSSLQPGRTTNLAWVAPHEKKIIEHPSSCYVLGRSGTGYALCDTPPAEC